MRDQKYYNLALKAAELSECAQMHGAVIVRSGVVLAISCNRKVTHPVSAAHYDYICTIHAEQRALIKARTDVRGATLYSAHANGRKLGKPCRMCRSLMKEAGISKVVYFNGIEVVKERL